MCSGCGQPKDEAWNPDAAGWYEAHEDLACAGCAALHEHAEKTTEAPAGAKVYLVNTLPKGQALAPWTPPSATGEAGVEHQAAH